MTTKTRQELIDKRRKEMDYVREHYLDKTATEMAEVLGHKLHIIKNWIHKMRGTPLLPEPKKYTIADVYPELPPKSSSPRPSRARVTAPQAGPAGTPPSRAPKGDAGKQSSGDGEFVVNTIRIRKSHRMALDRLAAARGVSKQSLIDEAIATYLRS